MVWDLAHAATSAELLFSSLLLFVDDVDLTSSILVTVVIVVRTVCKAVVSV